MKTIPRIMLIIVFALTLAFGVLASRGLAAIDIVAATPELADIAKQVGGSKVSVYSIAKPNQDYHMIEPRPSDVSKIARAELVVRVGLDLDMWFDALIDQAGNRHVRRGAPGYVDASAGIARLEVPKEQVTGASGDIHVYGNPHYFYDPMNAKAIAHNIYEGLVRVSPTNKAAFQSNYNRFADQIDHKTAEWTKELAPYKGKPVVTYHQSAVYFLRRFGLRQFGELEPKPGIPPTASHIHRLVRRMKDAKVTAVVVDSIYPRRFPDLISRGTGVKYVITPYSVGSMGTKSYLGLIDMMVGKYREALR